MEDPRIISALFIFLKMAYYNVLINNVLISLFEKRIIIVINISTEKQKLNGSMIRNLKNFAFFSVI